MSVQKPCETCPAHEPVRQCADCPRARIEGRTRVYTNGFGDVYMLHLTETGVQLHWHAGTLAAQEACPFCRSPAFPTRWGDA